MGSLILTVLLLVLLVAGLVSARLASRKIKAAKAQLKAPAPQESSGKNRGYDYGYEEQRQARAKKLKSKITVQSYVRWGSRAVSVLSLALIAIMCFTTVSAKNVGVAVTFGAVSENTRAPGIQTKLPWTKIIEIDGTIQTDQYSGENCIAVRIGDGSQACAEIVNRWQINPEKAAGIYEQHRSDDPTQSFRSAIVSTQLKQSVQEALKNYNPIAQLKAVGGDELSTDLSFAPDYGEISKVIEDDMKKRLSDKNQAQIEGITFSYLKLSENTQRKLDDYVAAIGETRIATQQRETAKAQAEANKELSASVSNDPNVLVSRCFDMLKDASQTGYQLPAGFSCWPGGGSGVVIPGVPGASTTE